MPTKTASRNDERPSRAERKRQAILDAATGLFLSGGFLGTNMDLVAEKAEVSKQTVYKHFVSKEALFIAIVEGMTGAAGDRVQGEMRDIEEGEGLAEYLLDYAERQLAVVLTPRLMQLRRLVIGEASRFPELGEALHESGPKRAVQGLAHSFKRLSERGLLAIDDPLVVASHFNWLVMGEPVNKAMLLGDKAIPSPAALRRHAAGAVRAFIAAYGIRR